MPPTSNDIALEQKEKKQQIRKNSNTEIDSDADKDIIGEKKPEKEIQPLINIQKLPQKYLKINHPYLEKKHQSCKHNNGCLTQAIDITARGFTIGFCLKSVLSLLQLLIRKRGKIPPKLLFEKLFSKENFNFAVTPAVYNIVLQSTTCLLRWYRNQESTENQEKQEKQKLNFKTGKYDAFFTGFLAGFIALMTKPQKDRQGWALFLLTRALESCYNTLINRGIMPKTKYNWIIFFALIWFFLGSQSAGEQGNLSKSFLKFENSMMMLNKAEIQLYGAVMQKINRTMYIRHGKQPFLAKNIFIPPVEPTKIFKFQDKNYDFLYK